MCLNSINLPKNRTRKPWGNSGGPKRNTFWGGMRKLFHTAEAIFGRRTLRVPESKSGRANLSPNR